MFEVSLYQAILALIIAIPKLEDMVMGFFVFLAQNKWQKLKSENKTAVITAIVKQDQRYIEELLGYSRAGEPSGIPSTEIVDTLPGVNLVGSFTAHQMNIVVPKDVN